MSTAWLVRFHPRHHHAKAKPRWLTVDGGFSSGPAEALVVTSPEAAAERLQAFVELKVWPLRAVERFALVRAGAMGRRRRSPFSQLGQLRTRLTLLEDHGELEA